jgi:thiosulfate/3-mercaptopyruvate sulfurtransferase
MERLGIGDDSPVIAYDDNNSLQAARFWWVLRHYGHTGVRLLNGGWRKWVAEGKAVSTQPSQPGSARFTPRQDDSVICRLDDLRSAIGTPAGAILDVRSDGEYAGTNARGNKRVGHIPGAAHIEWLDFMTKDGRSVFRPAEQIEELLQQAGLSRGQAIITYCQGGIRAAHAMFVLALMGYEQVRNYDGSMREWANRDDTPLELGA